MREQVEHGSNEALVWMLLIIVAFMCLPIYNIFFAVHEEDTYAEAPYSMKTLLNRGGLGWPYDEGDKCLVDLWATFTPLGTFEGQPVARYTQRLAWWSFKQCPTGSLIHMDMATLATWQDARRAEHHAAFVKEQALQALTNAAKAR
jgi:hypothetical protein